LEKIFAQFPREERIQEIRATFGANPFRAQVIPIIFPPKLPMHVMDKGEAFLIERETRARADRELQKNLFRESGILPNEFSLRSLKILERRIAGYLVPKLAGFRNGEIECAVLGMFLLESSFLPVKEFAKVHTIANVSVIHIAEALEAFARKPGREGVYLCLEEEKTQIAVQARDRFVFLGTASMGARNFTEFFSDTLGMREPTARIFQKQYFEGSLSVGVQEKMQTYLLPEIQKFGTLIKQKLLEAKIVLPGSIWVFGRGGILRNLQSLLTSDVLEGLPFSQKPKIINVLPIEVPKLESASFTLFEPGPEKLLPPLLRHLLEMTIYQHLLESYASEQGARMVAMQKATDNALEITEDLKLEYNKGRQEKITNEILDIGSAYFTYVYE